MGNEGEPEAIDNIIAQVQDADIDGTVTVLDGTGGEISFQQADSDSYKGTFTGGDTVTLVLQALGASTVTARIRSDAEYTVRASYLGADGTTIFNDTIASNVAGNTETSIAPGSNEIPAIAPYIQVKVDEESGGDATLHAVAHYN